ncbi:MAG: hypothetical protein M3O74_13905 [Pseudomonadota bacterium]|nr:hypothetical protein [Pseudomonadota bacterium]
MSTISTLRLDIANLVSRASEIELVRDEDLLYTILGELQNRSDAEKQAIFAQSRAGGGVFLFESKNFPGHIVESIPGVLETDSISCMFKPHPILAEARTLLKFREELVSELERVNGAAPGALRKADPGRHRAVLLIEMSTLQLADTLRETGRVKL